MSELGVLLVLSGASTMLPWGLAARNQSSRLLARLLYATVAFAGLVLIGAGVALLVGVVGDV